MRGGPRLSATRERDARPTLRIDDPGPGTQPQGVRGVALDPEEMLDRAVLLAPRRVFLGAADLYKMEPQANDRLFPERQGRAAPRRRAGARRARHVFGRQPGPGDDHDAEGIAGLSTAGTEAAPAIVGEAVGCRGLIVHYGRAPENIHPGPVNDMARSYKWLLDQGIWPEHIALIGDSAGGGLAVTTILRAREQGLPLPAATMPLSPWLDMEAKGETFETNAAKDLLVNSDIIKAMAGSFLGEGGNPHDPLANPLHADLRGRLIPVHPVLPLAVARSVG